METVRRPRARRAGEGTIIARQDGRYEVRVRDGLHRISRYTRTAEDARRILTKLTSDRDAGRPVIKRTMTVAFWLDRWLASHAVRASSIDQYTYVVERFLKPELGSIRLTDLRKIHVDEMLARIARTAKIRGSGTIGASTVASAQRALSVALAAAVDSELVATNVAARSRPPAPDVEIVPPTPDQCDRILDELVGDPLLPLFLVMRWSGCRVGEARGLRPADVDQARGTVTFARQVRGRLKTDASRRTMPMPPEVMDALARVPRRSLSHVFTTSTGAPLDNRRIERVMERAGARAGVMPMTGDRESFTPHSLRHAFAAELLRAGLPDSFVMTLLGHRQVSTTLKEYGHLRPVRGFEQTELSAWWSLGDLVAGRRVTPVDTQSDHHAGRHRAWTPDTRSTRFVLGERARS